LSVSAHSVTKRKETMKLLLSLAVLTSCVVNLQAADISYSALMQKLTSGEVTTPKVSEPATVLSSDGYVWAKIEAKDKYARTALLEAGFDITDVSKSSVAGFAPKEVLEKLAKDSRFKIMSSEERAVRINRDFPSKDAAYHNYAETAELLKEMASKNSDIASVFSIGKTTEGRDIWCLRINSDAKGNAKSDKPGAFFLGNHHAREHLSNEVPLLFAAYLLENRDNAEIKKYINSLDIFILPMLNPDGVEYDISDGSYKMFRKNMSKNSDGSRGTDLNRNYDIWWCQKGSSHTPRYDTYCGKSAFSEPESSAIKKFITGHPNLKTHISYHTYGGNILWPYGGSDEDVASSKDKKFLETAAKAMAKMTGYTAEKSSDMYLASGDSCDWAYKDAGLLSFTFELDGNDFYPGASIIKSVVDKNVKAGLYLLSVTDDPYKTVK